MDDLNSYRDPFLFEDDDVEEDVNPIKTDEDEDEIPSKVVDEPEEFEEELLWDNE